MTNRDDLLKMALVCLCLLHVTLSHSCGIDPRMNLRYFHKLTGFDYNVFVHWVGIDPVRLKKHKEDLRRYESCMGVPHTGYFKRSMGQGMS
ncbi:hypothetical protein ACOMHN_060237 [Nucella lapillus]